MVSVVGYLRQLIGENTAPFYARNLCLRYGLKANARFAGKMLLAALGLLPLFTPPPGGKG